MGGRKTMRTEKRNLTDKAVRRIKRMGCMLGILLAGAALAGCGDKVDPNAASVEIVNVSYDPTREFYEAYNKLFATHWKEEKGQEVEVIQSHGGSGKQALEVVNGLEREQKLPHLVERLVRKDIRCQQRQCRTVGDTRHCCRYLLIGVGPNVVEFCVHLIVENNIFCQSYH